MIFWLIVKTWEGKFQFVMRKTLCILFCMLILCCSGCSNQGIYSLKSEMSDKNDSMVELSKEISADAPTEEENAADSSVEETENNQVSIIMIWHVVGLPEQKFQQEISL